MLEHYLALQRDKGMTEFTIGTKVLVKQLNRTGYVKEIFNTADETRYLINLCCGSTTIVNKELLTLIEEEK